MSTNRYINPVVILQTAVETNNVPLASTITINSLFQKDIEQALDTATKPGRMQILQFLLNHPDLRNLQFNPSLQLKIAVATNDTNLLKKIPWDQITQAEKQDALNNATALGRFDAFRFLVDHRAALQIDINSASSTVTPPALHAAATHCNLEAVVYLTETAGVNVNELMPHTYTNTALAQAAMQGDMPIVDYLLKHGANPNITTPGFEAGIVFSPLLTAIQHNHLKIAERLLEAGANPSPFDIKRLQSYSTAINQKDNNPYAFICLGVIAERTGIAHHGEASAYYRAALAKGVQEGGIRDAKLRQQAGPASPPDAPMHDDHSQKTRKL